MGPPLTFPYYYGCEAEQYAFYRIPKLLITDERFRAISTDAKLLYGLMLDRMSLSLKNNWLDDENRIYIYFTVKEVMEQMNCKSEKATKLNCCPGTWTIGNTSVLRTNEKPPMG